MNFAEDLVVSLAILFSLSGVAFVSYLSKDEMPAPRPVQNIIYELVDEQVWAIGVPSFARSHQ